MESQGIDSCNSASRIGAVGERIGREASMTTKTRGGLSVRGALFLVGIFGVAALIVSVKGTPHKVKLPSDDDLHENITLSVIFKPTPRLRPVDVQAHVEGVKVIDEHPVVSPWNRVLRVPKGASVALYAFQPDNSWAGRGAGSLDCIITSSQPTQNGHRTDAGSVRCYLNRVGG